MVTLVEMGKVTVTVMVMVTARAKVTVPRQADGGWKGGRAAAILLHCLQIHMYVYSVPRTLESLCERNASLFISRLRWRLIVLKGSIELLLPTYV